MSFAGLYINVFEYQAPFFQFDKSYSQYPTVALTRQYLKN